MMGIHSVFKITANTSGAMETLCVVLDVRSDCHLPPLRNRLQKRGVIVRASPAL